MTRPASATTYRTTFTTDRPFEVVLTDVQAAIGAAGLGPIAEEVSQKLRAALQGLEEDVEVAR